MELPKPKYYPHFQKPATELRRISDRIYRRKVKERLNQPWDGMQEYIKQCQISQQRDK